MSESEQIVAALPHLRKEHRQHHTKDSRETLKLFAAALLTRRLRLGYSRQKVALKAGVSYSQLSHLELGDNWPTVPVYRALCRVLKIRKPPLL